VIFTGVIGAAIDRQDESGFFYHQNQSIAHPIGAMASCAFRMTPQMGGWSFDLMSCPLLFIGATIQKKGDHPENSPTF
jgi:hypothetical protein